MSKRCFTMINCPLRYQCAHGNSTTRESFQPTNVGEHCHSYKPLQMEEQDLVERLSRMAGAHE
jgi:hypothetical protein